MTPDNLHGVPAVVLFRKLPETSRLTTEHLTGEILPLVEVDLPDPLSEEVAPGLTVHTVLETRSRAWSKLCCGPAPLDSILGKFTRRLTDLRITVEDLLAAPPGAPNFGPGAVVESFFSVDFENAAPEDVTAAHVTLAIEKSWIETNDVHKWSIAFNRLDEEENEWVPFPSKQVREDEERIFYTVVVPGFSVIAVTGSPDLPERAVEVADLEINPPAPGANEEFTIGAQVTNISSDSVVYAATLWLNPNPPKDGLGASP